MRLIQEIRSSHASGSDPEVAPGLDLAAASGRSGGLLPDAMAPTVVDTAPDADQGVGFNPSDRLPVPRGGRRLARGPLGCFFHATQRRPGQRGAAGKVKTDVVDACKSDVRPAIIHKPVTRCVAVDRPRDSSDVPGVATPVFLTRQDDARGIIGRSDVKVHDSLRAGNLQTMPLGSPIAPFRLMKLEEEDDLKRFPFVLSEVGSRR